MLSRVHGGAAYADAMTTAQPGETPASPEKQHTSGDLDIAEDAPRPTDPILVPGEAARDDDLAADAAEESREKWWESEADAEG